MEKKKDYIDYGLEVVKGVLDIPVAAYFVMFCASYIPANFMAALAVEVNQSNDPPRERIEEYYKPVRELESAIKATYNFLVHGYYDEKDKEGTTLRGTFDNLAALLKNDGHLKSISTSKES